MNRPLAVALSIGAVLAIAGGLLFAAFLLLAARYIRLYLRSIG